ncbi:FAD-dependent monooxygenase [Actinomadura sp. 9N215]|uniref:FAD-dependent monooxygenase n=1 Tax=Actinomadura sp. 9N215 TaxID=3375150 RepID=UPI0037B01393
MITKAVIAGGGIGALTTALALQQDGVEVTVLERRRHLADVAGGVGLMVWHNGTSVLQRLGVGAEIAAVSAEIRAFEFRNWRGAHLMRWDVAGLAERLGSPTIGINRGDLHAVLLDALKPGTFQLGVECTGYKQDADGVTVTFADGGSERGDVLIAADGINSVIRTQLLGPRKPRYAGYTTWRGLADVPEADAPTDYACKFWGPGKRFLYYRVGGGQLYWLALTRAAEGGQDAPGGRRAAMLEHHRGWHAPVEAIIEATPEDAIDRHDITDHKPFKTWGSGRVTLLGDAAHAMTPNMGQGACQAIEDGLVIAAELGKARDPEQGLRSYEDERRKRTAYFQSHSRQVGVMGRWKSPLAVRARDAMVRAAFKGRVSRMHETEMRTGP